MYRILVMAMTIVTTSSTSKATVISQTIPLKIQHKLQQVIRTQGTQRILKVSMVSIQWVQYSKSKRLNTAPSIFFEHTLNGTKMVHIDVMYFFSKLVHRLCGHYKNVVKQKLFISVEIILHFSTFSRINFKELKNCEIPTLLYTAYMIEKIME